MTTELVYLSLGSNMGDSAGTIARALELIQALPEVRVLSVSSFYRTTPVSHIPQNDFINAACVLTTSLSAQELYVALHHIEISLGKTPKEKSAPRPIDIDIVLFGRQWHRTETLCIPHPHWQERLFVLVPLSELTEEIPFPVNEHGDCETMVLKDYVQAFRNCHRECVMREDIYLSRLAEEAETRAKGKARIPVEQVWKELNV